MSFDFYRKSEVLLLYSSSPNNAFPENDARNSTVIAKTKILNKNEKKMLTEKKNPVYLIYKSNILTSTKTSHNPFCRLNK